MTELTISEQAVAPTWAEALAIFRMTEADLENLDPDHEDDEVNHLVDIEHAAWRRFMETPAADPEAIIMKLQLGNERDIWDMADGSGDRLIECVARDIRLMARAGL